MKELHPDYRPMIARILRTMEASGFRPRLETAWRSPEEQLAAAQRGASEITFGFHNITGKHGRKEAWAADIGDDNRPLFPGTTYALALARAAEKEGLETGIEWGLQPPERQAIKLAKAATDRPMAVKLGWDPAHVQPVGISPRDLQAGKRPDTHRPVDTRTSMTLKNVPSL